MGPPLTPPPRQASAILACLGQAAFVWDIASDEIAWTDHLASVFPDIPTASLATGSEFAKLIEPSRGVRSAALAASSAVDRGAGVSRRSESGVRAAPSHRVLWIEESGCWFAGADGKPARVHGIVRI